MERSEEIWTDDPRERSLHVRTGILVRNIVEKFHRKNVFSSRFKLGEAPNATTVIDKAAVSGSALG